MVVLIPFPTINRPHLRHCEARSSLLCLICLFEFVKGCFVLRKNVYLVLEGFKFDVFCVYLIPFPTINLPHLRHCKARSSILCAMCWFGLVKGCFVPRKNVYLVLEGLNLKSIVVVSIPSPTINLPTCVTARHEAAFCVLCAGLDWWKVASCLAMTFIWCWKV